jgi:hypothetical protein
MELGELVLTWINVGNNSYDIFSTGKNFIVKKHSGIK